MDGIWTCHVKAKQIMDVKGVQITKLTDPLKNTQTNQRLGKFSNE